MDNKFLQRLKGEQTPKAVVEIQDPTLRQGMPDVPGTTPMVESVPNEMSNTLIVAKGAKCFCVNNGDLTPTTTDEYTGMRQVAGAGAWINASYTFPSSQTRNPVVQIINPNSKWILRVMGDNLLSGNDVINFTLLVRAGATTVATKDIAVRRQANQFCKTLEIDFAESVADVVRINGGDTLTVQLLCNDDTARANIYGGKTVLTLLDRALDGTDIQSSIMTFEEAAQKIDALERDKVDKTYVDSTFETKVAAQSEYTKLQDTDQQIRNQMETQGADLQQQIDKNAGEIAALDYDKASKATDFETPVTESNKGATMKEIRDVADTSISFKGYVGLTEPSSATYTLREGDLWINANVMPVTFPILTSKIRVWSGSTWTAATNTYTAQNLDAWRNMNDNEGYYWFAGEWVIMSTDLSANDFVLGIDGKWRIKDSVALRGRPEVQNEPNTAMGIATKGYTDRVSQEQAKVMGDTKVSIVQPDAEEGDFLVIDKDKNVIAKKVSQGGSETGLRVLTGYTTPVSSLKSIKVTIKENIRPYFVQLVLYCKDDDAGYATGDVCTACGLGDETSFTHMPLTNILYKDDGTMQIQVYTFKLPVWVPHKDTAEITNVTMSKWIWHIRIYY